MSSTINTFATNTANLFQVGGVDSVDSTQITGFHSVLAGAATSINGMFQDILAISQMLSSGIMNNPGGTSATTGPAVNLITRLGNLGLKIGTDALGASGTFETGSITNGVFTASTAVFTAIRVKNESLMENPGTLFLIQTIMTQMKDSMAALQAAAGTGSQALAAANADFKQSLR